jgi:hypothetical protein
LLADDVLHPMYDLASFLHPDPAAASAVTLAAGERLALLERLHVRSPGEAWLRLPEAWRPQYCVYLASDGWERAQERPRPGQAPRKRPTPDDYLVRYLKCLIWWTMDQHCPHVAVALGCFLYTYEPDDLVPLAPAFFAGNLARVSLRLASRLQARFPGVFLLHGDHDAPRTRSPTAHERQLVQLTLAKFTPWGSAHIPPLSLGPAMRDSHFGEASVRSNGDRIQAMIEPTGDGLPRLIREYNAQFPYHAQFPPGSARRLAEADAMLAIPRFVP